MPGTLSHTRIMTPSRRNKYSCIFAAPPWMRILVRDINDPAERLTQGVRGGVDIIDLSNICSCAFISTQDTGRLLDHGRFMIEGRIAGSDIRGCNLLVQ